MTTTFATEHPILKVTVEASGAVTGRRFVGYDGAEIGTAGDDALGVAEYNADDTRPCSVITHGTAIVEAGAAVTVGTQVMSNADGKAVTATASKAVLGVALTAATAAGEYIEILMPAHPKVPAA